MSALDEQDYLILHYAVDTLDRHASKELAEARRKGGNAAKQMALTVLSQRIATVRRKLLALEQATT